MKNQTETLALALAVIGLLVWVGSSAFANGGPFVLKYPNGDPAAKGVLARLDPDAKPAWETRLRVIKEDLKVTFGKDGTSKSNATMPPLVRVLAEYTIENPTGKEVEIDFGFPILRGVYISPYSMMPRPDVQVRLGQKVVVGAGPCACPGQPHRVAPTELSGSGRVKLLKGRLPATLR